MGLILSPGQNFLKKGMLQIKQGPGSSSRDMHKNISLSSSPGTKALTQLEDGNFRLSTRFLEHHPVTSPPTNQKKVTHPAAHTPNFTYRIFSPKNCQGVWGFLSTSHPFSLLGPAINLSPTFQFIWPHCALGT